SPIFYCQDPIAHHHCRPNPDNPINPTGPASTAPAAPWPMPDGADRGPPVNAPGAPRVPRVERAPSSPRFPYVVTEFIDGPSLRVLVERDGPQSGPALYRLAIGTATALAAVHQAGVVHRDLKPGNVLVGPDGPRVIDFGVARSLDATLTATSTVIGTPSYMAPEQLAGEAVGPAADVFAWGATIAYAANGRPPFGQDTIPAVMTRIMSGRPDLGGLTGPLRELVAQSLHRDPAKRPRRRARRHPRGRAHPSLGDGEAVRLPSATAGLPTPRPRDRHPPGRGPSDRDRADGTAEPPRRPPPSGAGGHPVPHCPAHPSG